MFVPLMVRLLISALVVPLFTCVQFVPLSVERKTPLAPGCEGSEHAKVLFSLTTMYRISLFHGLLSANIQFVPLSDERYTLEGFTPPLAAAIILLPEKARD